jgi:hypothetical protein
MKIIKCLFLLLLGLSSCSGQNACDCSLSGKSPFFLTCEEALSLNKQIIPCLIDSIDMQRTLFIGFLNPISSYVGNYHFNQGGIRAAYLVDYILSKDSVETVNKTWNEEEDWAHWAELTKPYRIYNIGIIFKQGENGQPVLEPLTHKDMVEIKKMYFNWWKHNKDKPIETLREEFRKGNRILQLPYVWI